MEIVDAQVHLNMVGIEAGLVAMDAVGVRAVVIDEFWGFDAKARPVPGFELAGGSYRHIQPMAELAVAQHPDRFGYVTRVQPDDPDIERVIGELRSRPGCMALRLLPFVPDHPDMGETPENAAAVAAFASEVLGGAYDRYLSLAEAHEVPLFLQANGIGIPGDLGLVEHLLVRHPKLQLILDHTGAALPGRPGMHRPARFDQFEAICRLARHENLAIKWGHAPRFSEEPYPFRDVQAVLRKVVGAFGSHRVMWASDWTLDLAFNSWAESLGTIREDPLLSDDDKAAILGGTVRRILRWPAIPEAAR